MKEIKHDYLIDLIGAELLCIPMGNIKEGLLVVKITESKNFKVVNVIKNTIGNRGKWTSRDTRVPVFQSDKFYTNWTDEDITGLIL